MSTAVENLPDYLKKYVSTQRYERYTAEDQAAWRYIMRQCREYFRTHAVASYLDGLQKTGISVECIPRIEAMDEALEAFGWGAIPVSGFIPPAAFLDFQARHVLPIAADMRTVDHIAYTPAPDIVHEAAGHAPVLADEDYATYLSRYAVLAQKAIMSIDDIRVYEAIRGLSDVKENPDCTPEQIQRAETALEHATSNVGYVSEAAKVARMNWWTVEYGLAGNLKRPKIYGAGLLSSVGESQNCLTDAVKKIPLTVDCTEFAYDITEPQPQLFVTPDMRHLTTVLEELEAMMSYQLGGLIGLERAARAKTVTTVQLDSAITASGILAKFETDKENLPAFIAFSGPVQLSTNGKQLRDHGRERHPQGFSSPIGYWKGSDKPPQTFTATDLEALGLHKGKRSRLEFRSGFIVEGTIKHWLHVDKTLLCVTWTDCKVTRGSQAYFEPAWGEFDMLVGTTVTSVFGGPADRTAFGEYEVGLATTSPARTSPHTEEELQRFEIYRRIRAYRESATDDVAILEQLVRDAVRFPSEWLIQLEVLELAHRLFPQAPTKVEGIDQVQARLRTNGSKTKKWLVDRGLNILSIQ